MKTNNFEAFSKTSAGRASETLSKKYNTIPPMQVWAAVHSEVVMLLPHLTEGGKYTAKQLCGPDIWSPWVVLERRVAGMCLAYLVKVGAIPLVRHLTRSGKGTNHYRLPLVKTGIAPLTPNAVRFFV